MNGDEQGRPAVSLPAKWALLLFRCVSVEKQNDRFVVRRPIAYENSDGRVKQAAKKAVDGIPGADSNGIEGLPRPDPFSLPNFCRFHVSI